MHECAKEVRRSQREKGASDRISLAVKQRTGILLEHCVSFHQLQARAGEIYYFVAHYAVSDREFALTQVGSDQGKYLVAQAKFGASRPK